MLEFLTIFRNTISENMLFSEILFLEIGYNKANVPAFVKSPIRK
jgi:hypothetical protein